MWTSRRRRARGRQAGAAPPTKAPDPPASRTCPSNASTVRKQTASNPSWIARWAANRRARARRTLRRVTTGASRVAVYVRSTINPGRDMRSSWRAWPPSVLALLDRIGAGGRADRALELGVEPLEIVEARLEGALCDGGSAQQGEDGLEQAGAMAVLLGADPVGALKSSRERLGCDADRAGRPPHRGGVTEVEMQRRARGRHEAG